VLLIADENNHALRSVDLLTGELSTISKMGFNFPKGLAWFGNKLLVANEHYISQVTWLSNGSVTNNQVAGAKKNSYVDGSFNLATFGYPREIIKVLANKYIVCDFYNGILRLMDFESKLVVPVCFNGENICKKSSQLPHRPLSVLKVEDDIYIGMRDGIYRVKGKCLNIF